jgi:UDP-glucose 4-epimerase
LRILVTGSTGFIGPHLVRRLAQDGHDVVSCSRARSGPAEAVLHAQHDFASTSPFPDIGSVDAVFHLAAASSVLEAQQDPARVHQINVQGTLQMLLFSQQQQARLVLASSQRVYRMGPFALSEEAPKRPPDLYGYTKLAAELYVEMASRLLAVPGAIVRPFSVYGPGQLISQGTGGVVSILAQRALAGKELRVLSPYPEDFVEVTDAAHGIALALDACQAPARAYNVATGRPTTILELARAIQGITGSTSEIVEDYSHSEPGGLVASIERAHRELGYRPRVRLEEGLRTYVSWLSAQPEFR